VKSTPWGSIFSHAGKDSLPARHERFSVLFPDTSCLARNELVSSLTKNTASGWETLLEIRGGQICGPPKIICYSCIKLTLGASLSFSWHIYVRRRPEIKVNCVKKIKQAQEKNCGPQDNILMKFGPSGHPCSKLKFKISFRRLFSGMCFPLSRPKTWSTSPSRLRLGRGRVQVLAVGVRQPEPRHLRGVRVKTLWRHKLLASN